ncbi:MAG: hypothetical protein H7274_24025 [Rhodoferax sp.]|nr:hypothetical protein [Rhodoferax sp.]
MAERLYGYFPMTTGAVFEPAYLFLAGFADSAPHRTVRYCARSTTSSCVVPLIRSPRQLPKLRRRCCGPCSQCPG